VPSLNANDSGGTNKEGPRCAVDPGGRPFQGGSWDAVPPHVSTFGTEYQLLSVLKASLLTVIEVEAALVVAVLRQLAEWQPPLRSGPLPRRLPALVAHDAERL
jgi:hypothetical protein